MTICASFEHVFRTIARTQVAECDVYRLEDQAEPGGFRYLLVEPFLDGKYLKVRDAKRDEERERESERDIQQWLHSPRMLLVRWLVAECMMQVDEEM